MNNLHIAIHWMMDNNYGNALANDGEIVSIMHNEFQSLRRNNEHMMSDYDTLDMCAAFGITDLPTLEMCISDTCGGQCLAGDEIEAKLYEAAAETRARGQHEMANLMEHTIGGLFYYTASLLNTLRVLYEDNVTEISVRRLIRFIMGHERQHALQTLSFIQEGRSIEQAQMLCTNIDDIEDTSVCEQYTLIPSEMEADEVGYEFMLSFE